MTTADSVVRDQLPVEETTCEPPRPQKLPGQLLATAFFILCYWLVVGIWLQDVDLSQAPVWWQEQLATFPLLSVIPTWLVALASAAASPRTIIHILIPGVVGWWLANTVAAGFVQRFYNFPTRAEAARFLSRLQQQRSDGTAPASRKRLQPHVVVLLITAPFALLFLALIVLSIIGPASLRGSALYNTLLVIAGGIWVIALVAYALSLFMSEAPAPGLRLERDTLEEMRETQALLRVGGPGRVIVGNSDAAVTEYNGRFCRVLGPGAHRLRAFEYVRAVVDLRPQEYTGEIQAMTQDGVRVTVEVSVTFRIDRDDRHLQGAVTDSSSNGNTPRPTREQLYLFGRRAVAQAAYSETVAGDRLRHWTSRPLAVVANELRERLSETPLVDLFDPGSSDDDRVLHADLVTHITRDSRAVLHRSGIELTSLHLGRLRPTDEVMTQNLNGWRSYWQEQRIRQQENAVQEEALSQRSGREAEVVLLQALLNSIQQAQHEDGTRLVREAMARRLLQALDDATSELPDYDEDGNETAVARLRALHDYLSGRAPS